MEIGRALATAAEIADSRMLPWTAFEPQRPRSSIDHESRPSFAIPCAPVGRKLCPAMRPVPSAVVSGTCRYRAACLIVSVIAALLTTLPRTVGNKGSVQSAPLGAHTLLEQRAQEQQLIPDTMNWTVGPWRAGAAHAPVSPGDAKGCQICFGRWQLQRSSRDRSVLNRG